MIEQLVAIREKTLPAADLLVGNVSHPRKGQAVKAIFRLDGDIWAEDLGSTNGTWVNTVRIGERTRLEKGDLLQVGGTVFEVGK